MKYRFEELQVWQLSVDYSLDIYRASEKFPYHEQYGLKVQLRRAASSIALNIAEGTGRYHKKDFVRFVRIAKGSLYETVAVLEIAKRLDYLAPVLHKSLYDKSHEISRMLNGLCKSLGD